MYRFYSILISCALLTCLFSCRDGEIKRIPDTLPDIEGNITTVSRPEITDESILATVLVRSIEGIEVRIPEASIVVTEETLIEDNAGQELSADVLQEGMKVKVWVKDEMRESFPVQAEAVAIRISDRE